MRRVPPGAVIGFSTNETNMGKTSSDPSTARNDWQTVSLALLVGVIVLGFSVFLVAIAGVSIGPPVETAPLFVWNTTAAAIALVLTVTHHRYAHAASALTGVLIVGSIAFIGSTGAINPQASPLGPISYVAMAIVLIASSIASWRRDGTDTIRGLDELGQ